MSRLASLKSTKSLRELATLLQFKPAALSFILYKQAEASKYRVFEIPKRNGGKRTIKAPIDALKLVQSRLCLCQRCWASGEAGSGRRFVAPFNPFT